MNEYKHIPVMLKEVLDFLRPQPGENYIDCTLGGAGYTCALAEAVGPTGRVLAIDLDEMAIANAQKLFKNKNLTNIELFCDDYRNIAEIFKNYRSNHQAISIAGIVFDLGLSSAQLADQSRGFSFQLDAPLDMGMGQAAENRQQVTGNIVNTWSEEEIAGILKEYGEERYAKSIARGIAKFRKEAEIKTTKQLVEIIASAIPGKYRNDKRIHFATRTFQALRIATNDELKGLRQALPDALELLAPEGKLAVVSFHSLEDRIVKDFFRQEAKDCLCPPEIPLCRCGHQAKIRLLSKAIAPSAAEIKANPRSRSAKLRVAEKISG